MTQLRCLVAAILAIHTASSALALDAFSNVAQTRPENLDLSTTASSRGGYFSVTYTTATQCPPLNEIHAWDLEFVDRQGQPIDEATLTFAADMPEHLHGMVTRPNVSQHTSPGRFRVDGVNFHMPGWWVITLDLSKGRGRDLAYFNVLVGEGICHSE